MSQKREQRIFLTRGTLWSLVGYSIVILGFGFAIYFIFRDFQNFSLNSLVFNPLRIFLSFLISLVSIFCAILIWRSILRKNGLCNQLKDDLRIYVYSLLGYMLPGGIWAILVRGLLSKSDNNLKTPLTVMAGVIETILTGLAGLFLCVAFLFLQSSSLSLPLVVPLATSITMVFLLNPKIFSQISSLFFKLTNKNSSASVEFRFTYRNLLAWFLGELLVVLTGSVALFVLLSSFLEVNLQIFVLMIVGWSFAVAISSLFFWLPGTPFIRDGTMVGILSTKMTVGFAVIFVVIQRLWSIITILLLSICLWLLFDLPTIVSKIKN